MAATTPNNNDPGMGSFLKPLSIDENTVYELFEGFCGAFAKLAEESTTQFLPTPISESILRPVGQCGSGRYVLSTWFIQTTEAVLTWR